jgi:hypothetical protein
MKSTAAMAKSAAFQGSRNLQDTRGQARRRRLNWLLLKSVPSLNLDRFPLARDLRFISSRDGKFLVGTVVESVPVVMTVQAVLCVACEPVSSSSSMLYSVNVEISSSSISSPSSCPNGLGRTRLFPATLPLVLSRS